MDALGGLAEAVPRVVGGLAEAVPLLEVASLRPRRDPRSRPPCTPILHAIPNSAGSATPPPSDANAVQPDPFSVKTSAFRGGRSTAPLPPPSKPLAHAKALKLHAEPIDPLDLDQRIALFLKKRPADPARLRVNRRHPS